MLTEITRDKYDVEFEIAYASVDNVAHKPIYSVAKCFLHNEAVPLLEKTIKYSAELGYRIKIFDAYRPTEAQFKLWDANPNPDFLANPVTGSPHSRGVAIDLTLLDKNGAELDMGTGFDDFTTKSFHSNLDVSREAQHNRRILLGIMTAAGWDWYENEWWHYQMFNPRAYPLLSDVEAGTEMM